MLVSVVAAHDMTHVSINTNYGVFDRDQSLHRVLEMVTSIPP